MGDKILLRQALYNLLKNAVIYNRENGHVTVSLGKNADKIVCRISNTGPGISLTNQGKIFDRFFRGDTSRTRSNDGFGLGLPLAREILRAHGGETNLIKSDLEDTTFEFFIPVKN